MQIDVIVKIEKINSIHEIEEIIQNCYSGLELEIITDILNEMLLNYLRKINQIQQRAKNGSIKAETWYEEELKELKAKVVKANSFIKMVDEKIEKINSK